MVNINSQQQSTAVTAMASTVNNSNRAMVIVAIEAQDSLRAKYLENAYSVAMSTLAAEAFREQRSSKLSVKLSGKNKKTLQYLSPISDIHTDTYTETETLTHILRHTESSPLCNHFWLKKSLWQTWISPRQVSRGR